MVIYLLDENGFYKDIKQVPEDYEVGTYETTIVPAFKPDSHSMFDGLTWHDLSEAAYMQASPAPKDEKRIIPKALKPSPNPQQQMLSQLALQQAQFQASQQKLNSQLALQLAQLTAKEAQNV
ncbi:hypothetical protein [Limosilactobacillus reuteri]|uniref:hypothetical protein n=1 Tax=Limosilactobacillus reuteri TaxID=1598 RepID=UPI0024B8AC04|nr:hypothetical protein [Limosilactobacillus reuteri]